MNIVKFLMLSLILCVQGYSFPSKEVFGRYRNKYFVESGSYYGDGIALALEVGYKVVYSIELSPFYFEHCKNRYQNYTNVHLVEGDSTNVLGKILEKIKAPATFWLDGHYSWGNTARGDTNSPILAELEAIKKHPIKTHTILIDDVRQFGTDAFDFVELEEVIEKILEINPKYEITFEDCAFEGDILVATVKREK